MNNLELCEHGYNPNVNEWCSEIDCKTPFSCKECGVFLWDKRKDEEYYFIENHECRPDVPVDISFVLGSQSEEQMDQTLKFYIANKIKVESGENILSSIMMTEEDLEAEGIRFDTGTGFGMRDWQMEMLPVKERLRVVEVARELAKRLGIKTEPPL